MAVLATGAIWALDRFWLRKRRAEGDKPNAVVDFGVSFFPVLFIVFVLRSFLYEPFQIPSGSMLPTLQVGDFILVNKYDYGLRLPVIGTKIVPVGEPRRGDVMVFFPPGVDSYYIKRVVGLPGDVIEVDRNRLFVNGERVEHEFLSAPPSEQPFQLLREQIGDATHTIRVHPRSPLLERANGRWTVPEGHYFMMGDNRDDSQDSRFFGPVPEHNVVGKAVAIWMHWEGLGSLPSFGRTGRIE